MESWPKQLLVATTSARAPQYVRTYKRCACQLYSEFLAISPLIFYLDLSELSVLKICWPASSYTQSTKILKTFAEIIIRLFFLIYEKLIVKNLIFNQLLNSMLFSLIHLNFQQPYFLTQVKGEVKYLKFLQEVNFIMIRFKVYRTVLRIGK